MATHVLPGCFTFAYVCIKPDQLDLFFGEKNKMSAIKNLLLYLVVMYMVTEAPTIVWISVLRVQNFLFQYNKLLGPFIVNRITFFCDVSLFIALFQIKVISFLCVNIDIIPIPWKVPFPSIVHVFWSTLSAEHWTKASSGKSFYISVMLLLSITDCF